jgi:hypothetical protein
MIALVTGIFFPLLWIVTIMGPTSGAAAAESRASLR